METSVSLLERLAGAPTDEDWRRLLILYQPLLRAWTARAGVPDSDADDLAQEVLLVVFREVAKFDRRGPGAFRAWLRTILVRIRDQALRHLTADKRDVDREEPLPGDSARGSELHQLQTPAEVRVPRDELIEGMNRVLDFLEDRDQQLLRLHYVDGLTFEQVATRLGQNAAALRQRAHRLLERLRRGVPLVMWTDQRRWAPIRSQALGLWCLRAWSPARVARELDIPEAAVVSWIKALPVQLRDSPDPGDPP